MVGMNFNTEQWKPVVGYEGLYEVSSYGRVIRCARTTFRNNKPVNLRQKILAQTKNEKGYPQVTLVKDSKRTTIKVHRLVALAFVENPENKPEVNHINENKEDNRAINLEWVTRTENMTRGTVQERISKNGLNKGIVGVKAIHLTTGEELYFSSLKEAEEEGFSSSLISRSCRNKWSHKGYRWEKI